MSSPFVAEIRMVGFSFAPRSWAFCNGQLMSLSQNTALYSLLGTTFGGDGRSNFGLPNLQGAFPLQQGQGAGLSAYALGQTGGTTTVTLASTQLPTHSHTMMGQNAGGTAVSPIGNMPAQLGARTTNLNYGKDTTTTQMSSMAVSLAGGSQPHNNMSPYLTVNYCIALSGIYPQRP